MRKVLPLAARSPDAHVGLMKRIGSLFSGIGGLNSASNGQALDTPFGKSSANRSASLCSKTLAKRETVR